MTKRTTISPPRSVSVLLSIGRDRVGGYLRDKCRKTDRGPPDSIVLPRDRQELALRLRQVLRAVSFFERLLTISSGSSFSSRN